MLFAGSSYISIHCSTYLEMPLDVYCRPCAQAGKYHSNPNQVHTLWCILCSCAKLTNIACLPSATYDATQAHVHLWNATAAVNIICQARHNFGDDLTSTVCILQQMFCRIVHSMHGGHMLQECYNQYRSMSDICPNSLRIQVSHYQCH